ncbi:TIGR02444 family protein [Pseudomonas knackmussii]|uniref:TIGR02444 family protein n=1 Tax=Pseudomonas knackmussii TaxID=65741 RepID=A0ABY4KQW2_9PSED|nr:TIGR02444 family protein [Pseudomonas knackmussii]UPQ83253.1 TIGR02444 family protein [Pseudomonas knackmussii]
MKRDDLWSFALGCYAQPGVEAACLELQSAGADVCLLLTGAWLEHRGISCDEARLERLRAISDDWRTQVVAPLRSVRQSWRQQATLDEELAGLRARVKALELDAENVQLRRLQSVAEQWPAGHDSTGWLDRLCAGLEGDTRVAVQLLRRAATAQLMGDD